jgi:Mg-chelatase subunit ChlD
MEKTMIYQRLKRFRLSLFFLLAMLLMTGQPVLGKLDPLPTPIDIQCSGDHRDTVFVGWKDRADDETNYQVELKIGDGEWQQVAVVDPNENGKYAAFRDEGVDVSNQERRYRVRAYRSADDSFSAYSEVCNNRRIYEEGSYRIFYGVEGVDDCPDVDFKDTCLDDQNDAGVNIFLKLADEAATGSAAAFERLGFSVPATTPRGARDMVPFNIGWCDGGGCASSTRVRISPALLETAFDLDTRDGDPIAWLVTLHELFHYQQFLNWGMDDPNSNWVLEGQARSIQDKICIGGDRQTAKCFDDIDTGFAGYVGEVNGYLYNPKDSLLDRAYSTALFWTYLTEKYGTSSPADEVEAGMDLMTEFWEESRTNPGRDGVETLNSALTNLGHTMQYRDVWKDFAVANYAKSLNRPSVPDKYLYADMAQPGGTYVKVARTTKALSLDVAVTDDEEIVQPWGARYYEFSPAADIAMLDIHFVQKSAIPLYYTVLGIKDGDLLYEHNQEARDLNLTLVNDAYDEVVVIVAGLENSAYYRYVINGTEPQIIIETPTINARAYVGDPASPGKFKVILELQDSQGSTMTGVDLDKFSFKVGDIVVPTEHVLAKVTVMDQHWFLLRAPVQDSEDYYSLDVTYDDRITKRRGSVIRYFPRQATDNIMLFDRSGSMSVDGKLEAAQATSRLFVDSWEDGDKIGLVSFNQAPSLNMSLIDWNDTSRDSAFTAINSLTASGGTNIGDTLRTGWDELTLNGDPDHDWVLVLLSDGKEEASTPGETFEELVEALETATDKHPEVFSVAIGPDADFQRMQEVARVTGGTFQYISTPATMLSIQDVIVASQLQLTLDQRLRMIADEASGAQPFRTINGPIFNDDDDFQDVDTITVEGGGDELLLTLSWNLEFNYIDFVELRNPSDAVVAPSKSDTRHRVWRVQDPQSGDWTLTIRTSGPTMTARQGAVAYEFLPPYFVQASIHSDVTMDVFLTPAIDDYTPGVQIPIVTTLTDTGPIAGATVIAMVQNPSGGVAADYLFDDGLHGDGAAGDGVYGNTLHKTGEPGVYTVLVGASGSSSLSGAFTRMKLLSFYLDSTGDRDGDNLPDEWEIRFGTDPDVADANSDPDNDGKTNQQEKAAGTDPMDPDSDDGGESDGTDAKPHDPSDDAISATRAKAIAGNGKVFLKYAARPEYIVAGIFRGASAEGPFTFYAQDISVSGVFTDTAVSNEVTYCYLVLGQDSAGNQSSHSEPTCATPKSDPYPPHGQVQINGGATSTLTPQVELSLWASDAVDPESLYPGEDVFLPPADSASGVTDMMISNYGDMNAGIWERYSPTKDWTLGVEQGLAHVYVMFRDEAGNESDIVHAGIHVAEGPGIANLYLPMLSH